MSAGRGSPRLVCAAACLLLAACGAIPSPLGKPAWRVASANSQEAAIEYDEARASQEEVAKAGKGACGAFGKEAQLASNQISLAGEADTRVATYRCKSVWDIRNEQEWERIRNTPDPPAPGKP